MRIPGLGGDVLAKLGASPVSIPGGQIYENLVSGAIDATEWVGPWNDRFMKFYEAAKYYYYPGMHEPGSMLAGIIVVFGGWFNKEINSADDFKGLKMRIPGLGGDVLAKLGASPVSIPGGQIYENLVSGAIDATEWVGPWNDRFMKFYEAAKYYYYPGMHEPG